MKDYAEGNITMSHTQDDTIVYNVLAPAVICIPNTTTCLPIEFLIDTGADRSMISYSDGLELGLEAPRGNDRRGTAYDANGNEVTYVIRKVDLTLGTIKKEGLEICWCTRPRIGKKFLGVDFFKDHKFIIHGKNKKYYILRNQDCIKCSK